MLLMIMEVGVWSGGCENLSEDHQLLLSIMVFIIVTTPGPPLRHRRGQRGNSMSAIFITVARKLESGVCHG